MVTRIEFKESAFTEPGTLTDITRAAQSLIRAEKAAREALHFLRKGATAASADSLSSMAGRLRDLRFSLEEPAIRFARQHCGDVVAEAMPLFTEAGIEDAVRLADEHERWAP